MDVQIEQQIQLLSRIQLAIDSHNGLYFLHGVSGVGKSHLANLILEKSLNTCCIKLNHRTKLDTEKLKQQLICELATDDFSDLQQPLLEAVTQRLANLQQSIVIIVDNASDLPQSAIAMLWHCVNDFNRLQLAGPSFSVILVGETSWTMPFFKALDKKENSLVAEFHLKPLSKQQSIDFMMAVHSQWSDRKIEQFVDKLAPEYRLPKQLIYGNSEPINKGLNKRLIALMLAVSLVFFVGLGFIYYLNQQSLDKTPATEFIEPPGLSQSAPVEVKPHESTATNDIDEPQIEQPQQALAIDEQTLTVTELKAQVIEKIDVQPQVTLEPVETVNTQSKAPKQPLLNITETSDEKMLLSVPTAHYSLMLGGYSNINIFNEINGSLDDVIDVYQYKTIRNDKPWFVLLYGNFATRAKADQALQALPMPLASFKPWPKPFTSIHQEIAAFASTLTDKN